MCNAWNHAPGCTCGWGGESWSGHAVSSNGCGATFVEVPPLRPVYASFTIPNASCPVCGSLVFFYQSPNGGRVFFDELGPPWPKHPCTDSSSLPAPRVAEKAHAAAPPKSYTWQREGWQPFEIQSVIGVDKDFLKITGVLRNESLCFYLKRLVGHHLPESALSDRSLALLRPVTTDTHQLSFLLPSGKTICVHGYGTLADARIAQTLQRKAKQPSRARGKGAPRRGPRQQSPTQPDASSNNARISGAETALALAFRRAQERADNT